MSIVELFDCRTCVTNPERFIYDPTIFRIRDLKNGWILTIHHYRDDTSLEIINESGSLIHREYCSITVEMRDVVKKPSIGEEDIAAKVIWKVTWPAVYDQKPAHPDITKSYIVDFFCFFKGTNSAGIYLDGVPRVRTH